jgi:uncharacterized protein (TIGR00290 family)
VTDVETRFAIQGLKPPVRYALMWSGGKDSALALARATAAGMEVARLLNFHDAETGRVRFHATTVEMLRAQAEATGVELRAIGTSWPEMDASLRAELHSMREEGFAGVVFGDIHLTDVRAWYEKRVTEAGLAHVEPIWGGASLDLLREFVESSGRAVVTCVDTSKLEGSWLGRVIDERFVNDIERTGVDACGENGEYHSFAFAGPMFAHSVPWRLGEERSDGRFRQVDLVFGGDNKNFRHDVTLSRLVDPRPTLENLAHSTGLTYEEVVHHALVRYASSGAEALLALDPQVLAELIAARKAGDWEKVAGIVDWLEAGLESDRWRRG